VNTTVSVNLTQNQFDALVSFTYNVGDEAEAKSTLLEYVNQGDYADADAQFVCWDHVGKQVSAGLLKRRKAEAALFAS
jgi:lysozyme